MTLLRLDRQRGGGAGDEAAHPDRFVALLAPAVGAIGDAVERFVDLMDQLAQRNLGEKVLIPCNMLRSGEDVFLDDLTVEDVRQALKTEVVVVDEPGADLVNCLIEAPDHKKIRRRQIYEQTGSSDSGQA